MIKLIIQYRHLTVAALMSLTSVQRTATKSMDTFVLSDATFVSLTGTIQLQFLVGDKEHDPTVFDDCPCEVSISGIEISKYNLFFFMNLPVLIQ